MTPRPTQEQLENAVYFWNADQPHGQLSQWYPKSFKAGDCTYPTAEHYMMCAKARLFGDTDVEKKILHEAEPEKVRDLGRMIAHFNHDVWEKHKFDLVCDGNRAKFSDPELREVLLATEDRLLVEASPVDKIWGKVATMVIE